VTSLVQHLGTKKFPRVKVGIDRPRYRESIESFVLSPFYKDERKIVEEVIRMAVKACRLFVSEGVESAMNVINSQNLTMKEVTS
jgi:PTH1 family peptidyl-tRNA hydrolase